MLRVSLVIFFALAWTLAVSIQPVSIGKEESDGFWCQAVNFQETEIIPHLSHTTSQVRTKFRGTCGMGSVTSGKCRRVALLIRGESFRTGARFSRNACTEGPVNNTIAALASIQSRVIRPLEAKGVEVHVFAVTYGCKSAPEREQLIEALLRPQLRKSHFIRDVQKERRRQTLRNATLKLKWNQAMLLQTGLHDVMKDAIESHNRYDAVLVLRFDTVIIAKDAISMLTTLDRDVDALLFPFWGRRAENPIDGSPTHSVADSLLWIPWPALPCFLQAMHNHSDCFDIVNSAGHKCYDPLQHQFQTAPTIDHAPIQRIGFMAEGKFNADTNVMANPIYLLIPRSLSAIVTFLETANDVAAEIQRGLALWDGICQSKIANASQITRRLLRTERD